MRNYIAFSSGLPGSEFVMVRAQSARKARRIVERKHGIVPSKVLPTDRNGRQKAIVQRRV